LLLKKGLSPQEVARQVKFSLPTVYRVQAAVPQLQSKSHAAQLQRQSTIYRNVWLATLQKHSGRGVAAVRQQAHAVYAWLYRHDRKWFIKTNRSCRAQAHISHRVDWEARDTALTRRVEALASHIAETFQRRRISMTSLMRQLGEAMIRANFQRLPQVYAALTKLVETPDQYHKRRIDAAVASLIESQQIAEIWKVQRMAGLREWTDELLLYARNRISTTFGA